MQSLKQSAMAPVGNTRRAAWLSEFRQPDFCLIYVLAVVDFAVLLDSRFSIVWLSELPTLITAGLLLGLYWLYRVPRPTPRLAGLLRDTLRLLLFANLAATLNYPSTGLVHLPLWDAALNRADRALGFNWPDYYHWINARPAWHMTASLAYDSAALQLLLLLVVFALGQRRERANELFYGFVFCGLLTLLIGALLPATGAFGYFHTPAPPVYVVQYLELRHGGLRDINLLRVQGLVQFPSFHAVLAGLFVYTTRGMRWLFWPLLALNLLMLASCPVLGGHYLVDLIAGLGLLAAVLFTYGYRRVLLRGVGPRL